MSPPEAENDIPFATTSMFHGSTRLLALAGLIGLASCTPGNGQSSEGAAEPLAPGTPIRFAGEVALEGAIAGVEGGAITLTVRAIGAEANRDERALRRSYEVRDPYWRTADGARRIYFHLDGNDALAAGAPPFLGQMELEARYDPDGNVATEEEGVVRATTRVRTGSRDIHVAIRPSPSPADPSAAAARVGIPKGS
jgi:hypothetical protein